MGLHRIHLPRENGGLGLTNLQRYMVDEELGWGSLGFATLIGVDAIPLTITALFGSEGIRDEIVKPWIEDTEGKYIGCWGGSPSPSMAVTTYLPLGMRTWSPSAWVT
ncbi:acyl-CoA dehydrogenase family protein [Vulcanisaeta souniana]|uniref:acyl-CoA dehydrogenase family protein n=1 Tax=Vulcanisaeta souniana TaxID=164452 RepID=UPI000A6529C2|nr:acyl-CoA dehydrogenase family protein [Vulcanisaeta souniana]